jgi:peptide deformylase
MTAILPTILRRRPPNTNRTGDEHRYDLRMGVDPAELTILRYPAPALRQRAEPVDPIDDHVRGVARRMIQLMHEAPGIGLAAPQVGLPWRLFVVHVPRGEQSDSDLLAWTDAPVVYVNPQISDMRGPLEAAEEGCLSLPDVHGDVYRPTTVTISATDLEGRAFSQTGTGLLARCWQHENDHLDGVLIIDRMVQLHRMKNRQTIRQMERQV